MDSVTLFFRKLIWSPWGHLTLTRSRHEGSNEFDIISHCFDVLSLDILDLDIKLKQNYRLSKC
jgi:hypothetical protein